MAVSAPRQRGIVVPHTLPWYKRAGVSVLCALARLLVATWRKRWMIPLSVADDPGGPVIFCVWHNRLAVALASNDRHLRERWRSDGLAGLVSASRDGAFLASILEHFGIQPIRGSSSRRGPQALLEATTMILEKNCHIVITPDGPRGPCYQVGDGIVSLAQLTGRPIIPMGYEVSSKLQFTSWDRFQVPLPFAKCRFSFGAPVYVPRDADDAEREKIRATLERAMREINSP